jgi:hypothetical protein
MTRPGGGHRFQPSTEAASPVLKSAGNTISSGDRSARIGAENEDMERVVVR